MVMVVCYGWGSGDGGGDEGDTAAVTTREYHENLSGYWRWCLGVG